MKKSELISKLTTLACRTGFQVKKFSPEILVGTAIVGVVATVVSACKATTKVGDIRNDSIEQTKKVQDCLEDESLSDVYTEEDAKKDLVIIRVQTVGKIAKVYAPSIIFGVVTITSILASHGLMKKRNAALAAAYMAIDSSFKDYRGRVVERFGEKVDYELKHGIKAEEISKAIVSDDGDKDNAIERYNDHHYQPSGYAKIFDEFNPNWERDSDFNLAFLLQKQQWANNKLIAKGYLFLNEVYQSLGFPETRAGQIVGWVYNPNNPVGDNYVDFGLFKPGSQGARDFINGFDRSVILDFNVDGNILDLCRFEKG